MSIWSVILIFFAMISLFGLSFLCSLCGYFLANNSESLGAFKLLCTCYLFAEDKYHFLMCFRSFLNYRIVLSWTCKSKHKARHAWSMNKKDILVTFVECKDKTPTNCLN